MAKSQKPKAKAAKAAKSRAKDELKRKAAAKSRPAARAKPVVRPKAAAKSRLAGKAKPASRAKPAPKGKTPARAKPVAKAAGGKPKSAAKPNAAAKVVAKVAPKAKTPVVEKPQAKAGVKDSAQARAKEALKGKLLSPVKGEAIPKLKVNRAKAREAERALMERAAQRPEDAEARRTRLKNLIKLGKERSYLTYAEINDHLPDVVDAEQIESMISPIVVGSAEIAMIICFRPSSIRLAISISPSRVSSSTEPISRMYMRTGSVVRPNSGSTVESAASASSSTSSSGAAAGWFSDMISVSASGASSKTWIPMSLNVEIIDSICSASTTSGRWSLISA